jgi:hypothetical protein
MNPPSCWRLARHLSPCQAPCDTFDDLRRQLAASEAAREILQQRLDAVETELARMRGQNAEPRPTR